MSRPYQHNFDTPQSPLNRQGPSNPATSSSAGGQSTSFKTNVNRAKTKRWVEAKSYSYDGDDWGEVDDYDEYGGYDEPPEPPQPSRPTGLRQQGQTINPAATSAYGGGRDSQQELVNDGRRAYGDVGGQPPAQQHNYGSRSATNPQHYNNLPYTSLEKGRSNSFDQGDERRAFSAGAAQYGMAPASEAPAPSHQERDPANSFPQTRDAADLDATSAPHRSPIPSEPYQHPPRQGPPGPPLQVQTRSSMDGQVRSSDQAFSPAASYRGVSYSEQGRQPSSGGRAQSITSNSSAKDFHGRRDFSPSAVPEPLYTQVSSGPQNASEGTRFPPRKSSLSQQGPPYVPIGHDTHPAQGSSEEDSSPTVNHLSGNATKALPFVRPADIYKRMEEERERERQSQESTRPSMDAIMRKPTEREAIPGPGNPAEGSSLESAGRPSRLQTSIESTNDGESNRRLKPNLDPVTERKSEYGFDNISANDPSMVGHQKLANGAPTPSTVGQPQQTSTPNTVMLDRPVLPNVSRISGFGESFFKPLGSAQVEEPGALNVQTTAAPASSSGDHLSPKDATNASLQHQPSLGFRTVVNQAFDDQIPPTPSSMADSSMVRTNSESTGGVSPIMSRGPSVATAHPTVKEIEGTARATPIITEDLNEDTSRPTSSSTLGPPKQVERKPSPSLVTQVESAGPPQPSFIPGHRRNISTPSPDNSPARTPGLEISQPTRQPQEVEMAMSTPIESNRVTDQASRSWQYAREQDRSAGIDYTTREADIASAVNESSEAQSPVAIDAVNDARTSFLETRKSNHKEPLISPATSPSTVRAESPGKNRVRDLAGMFESGSRSRSGSEQSSPLRGSSAGANTPGFDDAASRPAAGRFESFRPRLPGGWESFASNAPSIAPYVSNDSTESGTSSIPTTDNTHASTSTPRVQAPDDDIDVTPTTVKRHLSKSEHEFRGTSGGIFEDPFTAVAAAGSAFAGALVAAVGLGNGEDATAKEPETSDMSMPKAVLEDFGVARGRSASLQDTAIHPEASMTLNRSQTIDSVSSGAPTPPPKDTPLATKESTMDGADYFAPIEPLKKRPRSQITTSDQSTPPARPSMLPYMSTDTKPQDFESDRLRKEIVRSLSPVTHTSQAANLDSPSSQDQPLSNNASIRSQGHDSMVIPSEYDSYWNEPNSEDELSPRPSEIPDYLEQTPQVNQSQDQTRAEDFQHSPIGDGDSRAVSVPVPQEEREEERMRTPPAMLSHRFSWEQEPAELVAGSHPETLDHRRASQIDSSATSPELSDRRPAATNNPQETTEFQDRQPASLRDVSNDIQVDHGVSELAATEQVPSTVLSGHTMGFWGPVAGSETGHGVSPQQGGYHMAPGEERDGSGLEVVRHSAEKESLALKEPIHQATDTQATDDPYSKDPFASDPYSIPSQHGLEDQSNDVQTFDNQYPASSQHGSEDPYGEDQAMRNLLSTSAQRAPEDHMNVVDNQNPRPTVQPGILPLPPPPAGAQPKIPAFREILALRTPADRIRAYNTTREQFAQMNTGLAHWITVTTNETPEHAGLLSTMGQPSGLPTSHAGTPTRGKLSGLRSAGAQPTQQPYYQQYLNASSQPTTPGSNTASPGYSDFPEKPTFSSSGGNGSKLSSHQVQAKGKDLLKNAGVFGGKANVAAKGLFSKGKSKLRGSGGGDKAASTITSTPSCPSPIPDSSSRGMLQPQHQPLNTFQAQQPATSVYQGDPLLPVQATRSVQDGADACSTPNRPLSFTSSLEHAASGRPESTQTSESRNSHPYPGPEPSSLRADGQSQPSDVLSKELVETRLSSKVPSIEVANFSPSQESLQAPSNDDHPWEVQEQAPQEKRNNPVVIGDAAPTFLQQTAETESDFGFPKEVNSPKSNTSSNGTPTQANFHGSRRSSAVLRSQVTATGPEGVPPIPTHTEQNPPPSPVERETVRTVKQEELHDNTVLTQVSSIDSIDPAVPARQTPTGPSLGSNGAPISHFSGGTDGGTVAWPPPNTRVEKPVSVRISKEPNGTFHTADSGTEGVVVPREDLNRSGTPRAAVQTAYQQLVDVGTGGAGNLSAPVHQDPAPFANEPAGQPKRPFSFIEYSTNEPARPYLHLHERKPSIESASGDVHQDRPPSPISPQRSLTKNNPNEYKEQSQMQYSSDREIGPADDQSMPPNRHRSFSRPFKSPNLAQHPAFRQDEELSPPTGATDLPTQYYPAQIRHQDAILPRQQATEYQLEGVGPPPAEQASTKSRPRRGSRSSGFFKNLGNSNKAEVPPMPTGVERQSPVQVAPSPTASPAPGEKKKRNSLFRSLTGHHGSESDRSKESMFVHAAKSRTDLLQQSHPRIPSTDDEDFPSRGKSRKARSKLQKNPMADTTEQESGKKKRFSVLGSLFGRSSSTKGGPASTTPQSAYPALASQPQVLYSDQREYFQRQPEPSALRTPDPGYYTSQNQHYAEPPPGGYYAPGNTDHSLSRGFAGGYQKPMGAYPPRSQDADALQAMTTKPQASVHASPEPNRRSSENRPTRDPYPGSNSWTREQGNGNPPTSHFRSASGHSPDLSSHQETAANIPPNPTRETPYPVTNPTTAYVPQFSSEPTEAQQPRPYKANTFFRPASPLPPPPPPKDDWHFAASQQAEPTSPHSRSSGQLLPPSASHSRTSSLQPPPQQAYPPPQPHYLTPIIPAPKPNSTRHTLAPLRTDVVTHAGPGSPTPLSARKMRQMQIEQVGVGANANGNGGGKDERARGDARQWRNDSEERIVMSSTSYPGQEWQPGGWAAWDGN